MSAIDSVSPSPSSRSLSSMPLVTVEGAIAEDTLFVAVSREFKESESVLLWALQHRGASEICLLHVHIPDEYIPTGLGKVHMDQFEQPQIDAHRVYERERLGKKLDKYLQFCQKHGVKAGKLIIELDLIEDGIVKLITDKKIERLVMGAAIDKRYMKNMIEILSEKAKYVKQHAPAYCHIWFVCKKFLIHTREATERPGSYPEAYRGDERDHGLRLPPPAPIMLNPYDSAPSSPSSSISREGVNPYLDELERVKIQKNKLLEQYEESRYHISSLESRIEESNFIVQFLERKLESAIEMAESYKKERDEMQMERDIAIRQADQVKKQPAEGGSHANIPIGSSELSFQDIEKTTNKFDQALKIGEDDYGITYKGFFNIQVVVKIAHPGGSSTPGEFQEEVEILNKLKHPNIVNLIGICSESQALVYEYCANGNLEDQISYKPGASPLLWKTRVKIATELCSVLMFLHSHKPQAIIHGDLRAENIHLDSAFTCKLSNFRASILISKGTYSLEDTAIFYKAESRAASYANTDPEYFASGELTTRSDVYSFGIILLRLLTGKPAVRLTRQVQNVVDNADKLGALLDPTAEWPLEQAKLLAGLALRCCEMTRDRRPDLDPDVWSALESIKGLSH